MSFSKVHLNHTPPVAYGVMWFNSAWMFDPLVEFVDVGGHFKTVVLKKVMEHSSSHYSGF